MRRENEESEEENTSSIKVILPFQQYPDNKLKAIFSVQNEDPPQIQMAVRDKIRHHAPNVRNGKRSWLS